ncbi:hypothetical protein ZWY2020_017405 [Hordeum vulgare]|nr:hypothetical protein ZWY2020_017405 [Hordeum vulgare]
MDGPDRPLGGPAPAASRPPMRNTREEKIERRGAKAIEHCPLAPTPRPPPPLLYLFSSLPCLGLALHCSLLVASPLCPLYQPRQSHPSSAHLTSAPAVVAPPACDRREVCSPPVSPFCSASCSR